MIVATLMIAPSADDIVWGDQNSSFNCPIARWGRRMLPDADVTDVFDDSMHLEFWDLDITPICLTLPIDATEFIFDFDTGRPVAPGRFNCDLDSDNEDHRRLIAALEGRTP
jgi:hypothetical protein